MATVHTPKQHIKSFYYRTTY